MAGFTVADPPHVREDFPKDVIELTNDIDIDFLVGGRLCNFPTGRETLRSTHLKWVADEAEPLFKRLRDCAIVLRGHASRLGSAESNLALSRRRMDAVQALLATRAATTSVNVFFQQADAQGEEQATGFGLEENSNGGDFRAVDVLVFGSRRPPDKIRPPILKPIGATDFKMRVLGMMQGGARVVVAGTAVQLVLLEVDAGKGLVRKLLFGGAGAAGFTIASLVLAIKSALKGGIIKPVVGVGSPGPPLPFTTTNPVIIADFAGAADVISVGASRRTTIPVPVPPRFPPGPRPPARLPIPIPTAQIELDMKSEGLFRKKALVVPKVLRLKCGAGVTVPSSMKGVLLLV